MLLNELCLEPRAPGVCVWEEFQEFEHLSVNSSVCLIKLKKNMCSAAICALWLKLKKKKVKLFCLFDQTKEIYVLHSCIYILLLFLKGLSTLFSDCQQNM